MQVEISRKDKVLAFLSGILVGLVLLSIVLYQIPGIQDRVRWRVDIGMAFVRGMIDPVAPMPTPVLAAVAGADLILSEPTATLTPSPTATPHSPDATPEPTATLTATPEPTLTPTAIPASARLEPPKYERQAINNCGPATLSMHLNYYGWKGDQATVAALIKPKREDRNVNVEEMVSYVYTEVPWLEVQYRVGGDINLLKRLIAAGYPVTIEKSILVSESFWPNDDRWVGHYLLLTAYDDATHTFTAQDVFTNPNIKVSYQDLDKGWKTFNRVFILIYPPEERPIIKSLLGDQWALDANRQHALDLARREAEADPTDSFAWFNLGTNLVYFERYSQAAQAYDEARSAGLPQRMLRYQFGPFFAYFHTGRMDDLLALTDYALKRTPNSEEAKLWKGWALYRLGDRQAAMRMFQEALEDRPGYPDALYAIRFLNNN